MLRGLRANGYRVHLAFLSLPDAELALARVRERVRRGGHDVPVVVVRRRYVGGLCNFFGVYQNVADEWQLLDNSDARRPSLIASGRAGCPPEIFAMSDWNALVEQAR